jgi:hypothetical protein
LKEVPAFIFRVEQKAEKRWAGHVALIGESRSYAGFWWRNLKE